MANEEKPAPKRRRKPSPAPPVHTEEAGASSPEEIARRERIASIKKAIEDGTYHVSSEEVARKVIEHMLEPKK